MQTASSSAAAPLRVGPLRLWTPVVLAPMAGVTDVPFRRLCRIMGESGLPDHLRPTGIPSWAAESGEGATASSPLGRHRLINDIRAALRALAHRAQHPHIHARTL